MGCTDKLELGLKPVEVRGHRLDLLIILNKVVRLDSDLLPHRGCLGMELLLLPLHLGQMTFLEWRNNTSKRRART